MRFMPLIIFALIATGLGIGLTLKPTIIPSAMVGKPLPQFSVALLEDGQTSASKNLTHRTFADGETRLLNVFASWCQPCRIEHPLLMQLATEGHIIVGVANKDAPQDSQKFLDQLGDPYQAVGMDLDGRLGIALGTSGVPETFIIDGNGMITYQHIGYIDALTFKQEILPRLEAAKAQSMAATTSSTGGQQ